MKRRLDLTFKMLKPEGMIFISIDDHESAALRLLLDDIFGPNQHVATLVRKSDGNLDNQAMVKTNHEYIVFFMKDIKKFRVAPVIDPNIGEDSKLFTAEIRNSVVKNGPKNPQSTATLPAGFPASIESGTTQTHRGTTWPHYLTDTAIKGGALTKTVDMRTG